MTGNMAGEWERVRLGDVCDILDSQRIPITSSERISGPYPYYGANGIQDYVNDYIFDDELVLLAEDGGNFGETNKPIAYRVSGKCWVNNHAHVLKPKETLNVDYLCYSIMFYDVSKLINGTTRKKLNQASVRIMQIPLPPLDEQKRIADVLDKASELINKRKEQIRLMDELAKSLFIEMFGDPVENPMGWDVKTVANVCNKIVGGGTPSKSHPEYFIGDIPWISPKDMKKLIISDSIDHINQNAVENSSTTLVPPESVLMVIRSGILKHTLPVAMSSKVVALNQDMKAFTTNELATPWYLLYFFKAIEPQLLSHVRAVTADNIEYSIIKNHKIPVPPLSLQNEFADRITAIEQQKALLQNGLAKMETAYKALMQEYFG